MLGKETIDIANAGESRGREKSVSTNYQRLGKDLMTMDELSVLDGSKCILQLRGVRPFLSRKYDITRHPMYQHLSYSDPKNAFDIEAFLHCKLKLRANEQFDAYEMDVTDADLAAMEQEETDASPGMDDETPQNEPLDPDPDAEDTLIDYGALF